MATSELVTSLRRTISNIVDKTTIKKKPKKYRDTSREYRRLVASEIAYKEMEKQKDTALIVVHRY